ncbi:MAG: DUF2894 domain-containing protein [Acidovorax sp.]|uniref:DUF2894 domain-containing protein n=1 Tax=Acidovorax sp. TaxID=1872122 RepID=UPI0039E56586
MSEAALQALRAEGQHVYDPVRFRYLEALAARLAAQPQPVQRLLRERLHQAATAYADAARQAPAPQAAHVPPSADSPLAQLNRELQARAQADADMAMVQGAAAASDMKSVRQFGEVWSRISAERQVVQALDRAPENAGPLNPHRLMLRSLGLMRSLSPDYLRRFLAQMDALLWLEQAQARQAARAPLRQGRRKIAKNS